MIKIVLLYLMLGVLLCGFDATYGAVGLHFFMPKFRYMLIFGAISLFWSLRKKDIWVPLFCAYGLSFWSYQDMPTYGIIHVITPIVLFFTALWLVENMREVWVELAICNFGLFQAVVGLLQVCGMHFFYRPKESWMQNTPLAFLGQQTLLGPYLIASLAPCLWGRKWIYSTPITICILFTKSSMTYGALCVLYTMWFWHFFGLRTTIKIVVLGLLGVLGFYLYEPTNDIFYENHRLEVWAHAVDAWKENIIFGGGPAFWQGIWQPQKVGTVLGGLVPLRIHNEYLELLCQYGLVGLAILLGLLRELWKNFKPSWPCALIVALMANAIGNFPFHLIPTSLLFMVAWLYTKSDYYTTDSIGG